EELEQRVKELEKEVVERKEDALKASTRQWQTIFDAINDAVCLLDLKHNILTCNKTMSRFVKKTSQELIGRKCWEVVHGTSKPIEGCPIPRMRKTLLRETMLLPIGDRWFNVVVDPLLDDAGKLAGAVHSIIDITQLKQSEEALKSSEAEKRAILDATMELIVYHDTSLKIIWANKAAGESVGLVPEKLAGSYCYEKWCHLNEPLAECPAVKAIETGQPQEVEISSLDGKFWIHKGYSVYDKNGGIKGVVTTAMDITEHKQAEEERKKLEVQLQQARKMEAIGTLAGGIAHDFNNVQRGANLTRQLLGFARQGKYEVKPTDLNEVIDKSSKMFGRTKKEIRIHRKYQKHIWTVEADKRQIEQVLLNLYINAWQSMSHGGDLYIETSNVVIDNISATTFSIKPGEFVLLTLTGPGHRSQPGIGLRHSKGPCRAYRSRIRTGARDNLQHLSSCIRKKGQKNSENC
ncbi:MAG: PAS domain-containing protein, partial [Deltaproteobacteria bacterium]|nr:PAS domain-containing protein [Deltaproteobacteria bacterium]